MDLQIDQLTDIATCRVGIAANNMTTILLLLLQLLLLLTKATRTTRGF